MLQRNWRCLIVAMALVVAGFAFPFGSRAFAAADFAVDGLATELQVHTDGSVRVISRQVLTFSSENAGYTWYLHQPAEGESLKVSSIRVAPASEDGAVQGEWMTLQMVDVDADLQGEWPGDAAARELRGADERPWYSLDLSNGMVRSWFPAAKGTYILEADYSIANYVRVYRDVAELSWRYAHASMPVDSRNVSLLVSLPLPHDVVVTPGDDVVAWGHGAAQGRFSVNEDGTVEGRVDVLESGTYSEMHVVFPADWMTNIAAGYTHRYTEMHKQEALMQEAQWIDASCRGEQWDFRVRVLCFALAAVVLLVGIVCVARFGRTPRSRRALGRAACVLAVGALAVQLFLREPFTVNCLVVLAAVVALLALLMPRQEEAADEGPVCEEEKGTSDDPEE